MNKCTRCNIKILDNVAVCPLCRGALTKETIDEETKKESQFSGYPDMGLLAYRKKVAMRIVFFIAIVAVGVLVAINLLTNKESKWSLICAGSIFYALFTFGYTFQPKVYHQTKIIMQGLLTMFLVWWIDFVLGYKGWSFDYAIPLVLLAMNGLVLVLMLVRRKDWQSYALTQLRLFLLGVLMVLLVFFEVVTTPTLSIIAIAVTFVILFGMMVIGSRKMTIELRRLFRS